MIKHSYEPTNITPGRCGASELVAGTEGHFRCCGQPESHETHNQAHCQVCKHHFTPLDDPLCPRCSVYVPEAFEVIVRRLREENGRPQEHVKDLNHDMQGMQSHSCLEEANWNRNGDEYGNY